MNYELHNQLWREVKWWRQQADYGGVGREHAERLESLLSQVLDALPRPRDAQQAIKEIIEVLNKQLPQGFENAARHIAQCLDEFGRR